MPWNRVTPEIVWRPNDRNGDRASEGHGNHVLLDTFSHATPRIEPSFDDIDVALVS
jgi:hypothetical protein